MYRLHKIKHGHHIKLEDVHPDLCKEFPIYFDFNLWGMLQNYYGDDLKWFIRQVA